MGTRSLVVLLAACVFTAPSLHPQELAGVVADSASQERIAGARVILLDSTGTTPLAVTVTSLDGRFSFKLPYTGQYRLVVSRIGYSSLATKPFVIDSAFVARVSVSLPSTPLTLDTVAVVGIAEKRLPYLADAGFYRRRQIGFGRFLTRADIDKLDAQIMSDLLHDIPGVRVVCTGARHCTVTMRAANTMFMRGPCQPSVVIDGVVVRAGGVSSKGDLTLDDLINPFDVEAVEVYPGPEGVPVQYSGSVSPCGAIIVWSRR